MESVSASQFPEVYQDLGIDVEDLGCIMADTDTIIVSNVLDQADLYYADDREFVQGIVSETVPHVTLLYGLLSSGTAMQKHVDAVLNGWDLRQVQIASVDTFAAPDSPYACIVAKLVPDPQLLQANDRLRLLPHIDTYPSYLPHITLAYVNNDVAKVASYITELNRRLALTMVPVKGINYGK